MCEEFNGGEFLGCRKAYARAKDLKLMDAGIIIGQGETLLGHAAMQHDERLRLVALLYSLISFFICLFLVFFLSPFSVQDILGVTISFPN